MDDVRVLISKSVGGDKDAFGKLYGLYYRDMYRFALFYLGSREDAEDAVQEAFLAGGVLSNPMRTYHLEFSLAAENADKLARILESFNLHPKKTVRGGQSVVYIKEAEEISQVLSVMGATRSLMTFEQIRVEKSVANDINRRVNFEAANLHKTVDAALAQAEAIELIRESGADLPPKLAEVAALRVAFPDDTLAEIGARLNPPVGKSGVNHRMRRILEMAQAITERGDSND
jgi:DNA-binding protein WhiA